MTTIIGAIILTAVLIVGAGILGFIEGLFSGRK